LALSEVRAVRSDAAPLLADLLTHPLVVVGELDAAAARQVDQLLLEPMCSTGAPGTSCTSPELGAGPRLPLTLAGCAAWTPTFSSICCEGAMPTNGQTGLVIPVPAVDALLASVETRHPGTVREGVSAHVSLLYPFVGAAELDERVTQALSEMFGEHEPMPIEFAECYRRGGFVALRPDPIEG
jgi:2'-5' RNA ligase superfamily protein